jgi:predicted enzyme related to lactoylglutathione lyase
MPVWVDAMVATPEQHQSIRDFFSAVFGWTWELGGAETGYYSFAQSEGRPVFGLGQDANGTGTWITYFSTSDIAASHERAVELGAQPIVGPVQVMDLGSTAVLADPTGAVHGLWQPGSFHGFGIVYEIGSSGWFDHSSTDPSSASSYYSELTGFPVMTPDESMRILHAGEQWFASFSHDQVPGRTPQWNAIYIVESLETFRQRAIANGATIVVDEMPVPGSAICVITEPVTKSFVTVMGAGSSSE